MKKSFEIQIPSIPNYLIAKIDGKFESISLAEFSDDEIKKLGEEWVNKLLTAGRNKREQRSSKAS